MPSASVDGSMARVSIFLCGARIACQLRLLECGGRVMTNCLVPAISHEKVGSNDCAHSYTDFVMLTEVVVRYGRCDERAETPGQG